MVFSKNFLNLPFELNKIKNWGKSKLQVPTSAWGRAKNRWKNFPGVKTRGAGGEPDAGASRNSTECVAGGREVVST